jgi:CRISPR-associated protein Cas2
MSSFSRYVISYDISSQQERNRVSEILAGYGFRVQKSVFECSLSAGGKAKMLEELGKVDLQDGCVYIYHLNKEAERIDFGQAPKSPDSGYAFIV